MKKIPNEKICLNCIEYMNLSNKYGDREPLIFAWYRDPQTKLRKKLTFSGFEAYFYVTQALKVPTYYFHKDKSYKESLVKRMEIIPRTSEQHIPLKKVIVFYPHQVRMLRRLLEKWGYNDHIFEADIPFVYRFLIDKKLKFALEKKPSGFVPIDEDVNSNIRVLFLDIEIFSKSKPDPKKLRKYEEIICCTIWDNYTNTYYLFYQNRRNLNLSFGPDVKIIYCSNESDLLRRILKFILKTDPDIISGFNIDFDLIALIKCMEQRHLINPDPLSPLRRIKLNRAKKKLGDVIFNTTRVKIYGRNILDLLEMYLKVHLSGLSEMTLEYIAKLEKLPVQKVSVPDFFDTWLKNPELIIKRNLADVQIYVELDKKLDLIAFADEQRKLVGCNFEDTLSPKKMLDLFMLRMKGKRIMPTARMRGKKYPGAYVHSPQVGLYDWTIQVDYSHLYPSIMMCFNIDPDRFRNPQIWKGPRDKLYILDETHAFLKEPRGLLPSMLQTLLDLRQKKKDLQKEALEKKDDRSYNMYALQEKAVKVLANATYGVMGYRFRKGDKETVESVTLMGRFLLEFAIQVIEGSGRKVIYGDTDSVFFKPKSNNLQDCIKESFEIQKLVESELPKFLATFGKTTEQPFELEPSQVYSSFFILSKKKRYAGIVEWDKKRGTDIKFKYNIKGLETKRSDISDFGKRIQREVIKRILYHEPKDKLIKWVEGELNIFDQLPLMEIGIPAAIGKPLKSYKGNAIQKTSAEYSNKNLKSSFLAGSKPKRVYIKEVPEGYPETHSLSIDWNITLPQGFKIDYPKMLEVMIRKKIDKLLEIDGIKWEEINLKSELQLPIKKKKGEKIVDKKQRTLTQFN